MLPLPLASGLLLLAGLWWGVTFVAWLTWERRFASPGRRQAMEAGEEPRSWKSKLEDAMLFGLPPAVSIRLALDGLLLGGRLFYSPSWSFPIPFSDALQAIGAILLLVGLPLFTSGAYLTGKYVYSKLPEERPLLQGGPYRFIRHPIYLSFVLTALGFVLLSQNVITIPLLFGLTAIRYPAREEKELIRLYGDEYVEYRRRTGRFLPRIRRG